MGEVPPIQPDRPIPSADKGLVRFGTFEVNLRTGELRKNGLKIRLHGQPFAVLALLLDRPGEMITREEIQQKLWASDTFVDFEHGLNKAINRLREALGDDADNPRYIETLPRRGYRFVGAIAQTASVQRVLSVEDKRETATPKAGKRRWWAVGLGIAGLCALLVAGYYWSKSAARVPKVLGYRRLTTGLQLRGESLCGAAPSLATDGLRVFFSEPKSPVSQVSAKGGEAVKISTPFTCFAFSDISPDKTELLGIAQSKWTMPDQPLWTVSVASGAARRLGNLTGHAATWSPDGKRVVYAVGPAEKGPSEVYIAATDAGGANRLVTFERGFVDSIRWSPDGKTLRIMLLDGPHSVWEVSANGGNPHRVELFPEGADGLHVHEQSWTSDGRYSLLTVTRQGFRGTSDIWALREARPRFLTSARSKPVQLTAGAMNFEHPTASPDGKQVFAVGGERRGELVRYDTRLQRLEPFLSGISADHLDFSRDGKWVTYVTFPDCILWRSRIDGSERLQLTTPPLEVILPRWSPDGKRIAFNGSVPGTPFKLYVVSAEGGRPDIIAEDQSDEIDPTWTADGNSLIIGGSVGVSSSLQISSVDLRTGRMSVIPGSQGLYSPRVSPDGRFIVALDTPGNRKLMLFDQQTQKWTEMLDSEGKLVNPGWPQWSADSRYVYLSGAIQGTQGFSLYRVGIANHKPERIAEVEVPEGITGVWEWTGVTPDGSPLVLRDRSIQEIYAIDVDLP